MAKTRAEKTLAHDQIVERLKQMKSVVFAGYSGLTVKDTTALRNTLRAAGVDMVAAKKTILRRALKAAGLSPEPVDSVSGEIALVFGFEDEVLPAKMLATFAKDHEAVVLKGAFVDGQYLDTAATVTLAKLPGRDELRTKLVWILSSPLSGLAGVLSGVNRGLVNVLNARREQLTNNA